MSTLRVFQPTQLVTKINAPEIKSWIDDSVASGAQHLLIDLQNVAFIDSTGLGALVSAYKAVRTAGCTLALCSLNKQAQMVIEIAGLEEVFEIYASREVFESERLQSSIPTESATLA